MPIKIKRDLKNADVRGLISDLIGININSVLEFQKSDARIVNDRNDMCYVLTCPVCSNEIWISSTALRPVVQSTDFRDQPYEPK